MEIPENQIILISSKLSELDRLINKLDDYKVIVDDNYIVLDNGDYSTVLVRRTEDEHDR